MFQHLPLREGRLGSFLCSNVGPDYNDPDAADVQLRRCQRQHFVLRHVRPGRADDPARLHVLHRPASRCEPVPGRLCRQPDQLQPTGLHQQRTNTSTDASAISLSLIRSKRGALFIAIARADSLAIIVPKSESIAVAHAFADLIALSVTLGRADRDAVVVSHAIPKPEPDASADSLAIIASDAVSDAVPKRKPYIESIAVAHAFADLIALSVTLGRADRDAVVVSHAIPKPEPDAFADLIALSVTLGRADRDAVIVPHTIPKPESYTQPHTKPHTCTYCFANDSNANAGSLACRSSRHTCRICCRPERGAHARRHCRRSIARV